ncbi:MAG TPA: hypothetical protein DIC64_03065 [Alphaproteobacteria bacterium]|nr:hypothetical protein [Alphaproteobacteria bacterium]
MTSSNETLKHIIRDYNPQKQEVLCRIDLIKLSQMEVLKNPTPDKKDVYETFFDYTTALHKHHPGLDKKVEEIFGPSLEKMAKIAPEAYQKYEKLTHPDNVSEKRPPYHVAVYE